ncbi:phospholipase/Carboxylesterase family protein [Ehrlichia chaffeensis str. Heartland]|uniref:Phospholipase/carboxylesterase family protein n=1 Tax=Ehrlichia chaffeensis (strain ATCC CRL-10679 / Arkansas) TaxID=205920 RepID=Q2GFQ9_EHRCR|nr:dienelactone hydrolase family protein [Ehrlichia chaffeensis]ABD45036.1 phospholipase/carboxylesterase family protein [Ehrlichia chaffeensis str. Arkansas]AHX03960.1 phospholipase/Carboxylesterase family protein [Ehrlichia chaffeensis str. Heartland]AHX05308.1 phospholipase/Carboxylesterase family protein [Ehrlichia chaffeensis str. Jax]AHX06295.1 phospholipase/Carboxylesterase family protein [Ehrlichia chaffeensis str. Liberty]AHX07879.1 phospholipase/Carboxylesterase family protein [Ehrli
MSIVIDGPSFTSGDCANVLVVLLHGRGATGNSILSVGRLMGELLPNAHFIAPNAHMKYGDAGYAWFNGRDFSEDVIFADMEKTALIVNNFIDLQLKNTGLSDDKLVLAGFSQGAMLAVHIALLRKRKCASVISYSGAIICPNYLKHNINVKPDICIVHGTEDDVVPFSFFNDAVGFLLDHNVPLESHAIPGLDHSISNACIEIGAKFIMNKIS